VEEVFMKRLVAVVVLVALLINCTYSTKRNGGYRVKGPIVVSERVGGVIDAEERAYYNLFLPDIYLRPMTYSYKSATLRAIEGGGYELWISTTAGTLIVVNRDPDGIQILSDYINNYEEIIESREIFVEKWGIVDYDFLSLPITKNEIQLTKIRMGAAKKGPPARRRSIKIGAGLGGCVGGIIAYILVANREMEYELGDPDDVG
jgi:hypothetical protein